MRTTPLAHVTEDHRKHSLQDHLSKLENRGRAVNLEKMIGEIMDGIQDFPAHLRLADQGRFAVGYYHQRQSFFSSTSKDQQSKEK